MEVLNKLRILVIQTAFIGDAILTLPMIQMLRKKYPQYEIDVLCIPASEEIFKASPYVNDVIVYDKKGKDKSLLNIFSLAKFLKRYNYSAIYSPHRSIRTSLIVLLTGIKNTFGFSNSALKEFYGTIINYNRRDHEVKRNLTLAGINEEDWRILPEIMEDSITKCKVDEFMSEYQGTKFAAIAPGSVWETKKYPLEYYIRIAHYLTRKNYKIILIGSRADLQICMKIQNEFPENTLMAAGDFTIVESIAILKRCSILICNDSAPTHMGMAANIPVITIYCSTIPGFGFYPYNNKSTSISFDDLGCKPCGIHGHIRCPINTFECAHKIPLNKIFLEIDKISQ